MPRENWLVTYEIVTPESSEHGEAEERGYCYVGEWHFDEPAPMTLRDALKCCCPSVDCGRWFADESPIHNRAYFEHCHEETRALHPPRNITAASYRRVARLLGLEP